MRRGIRRVLGDLTGRGQRRFVELLARHIEVTSEGARLIRDAVRTESVAGLRDRIRDVEHEGDRRRAELVEELGATLVTPIDREDLFRLSRSVDDVLDNLRDFARELELYRVSGLRTYGRLLDAVIEAMDGLADAVGRLVDDPYGVTLAALRAKKGGGKVRQFYQLELARLFERDLDMDVLKHRELLRRLDVVGLRVNEAADALADGALKRSH